MPTTRFTTIAGLTGLAVLAIAGALVWIQGSVLVIDETRGVERAHLSNGNTAEQAMTPLWGGIFLAIPHLEGEIVLTCANGTVAKAGYVTGHVHTWIKVTGPAPCQGIARL